MDIEQGMRIKTFNDTDVLAYVNLINDNGFRANVRSGYIEVGARLKTFYDKKELARLIRNRRVLKRLSKDMLADRLGVTRGTINCWEAGKITPNNYNMNHIMEVLNITKGELVKCER